MNKSTRRRSVSSPRVVICIESTFFLSISPNSMEGKGCRGRRRGRRRKKEEEGEEEGGRGKGRKEEEEEGKEGKKG